MGCGTNAIKCCLNTINTLAAIGGVILIAFGILTINKFPPLFVGMLIFIGALQLACAVLGCCGICKENICMTTAYAATILFSFIIQLIFKFFISSSDKIRKFAKAQVEVAWEEELKTPGFMDEFQTSLQCCGKYGPDDYLQINRPYPQSCYHISKMLNAMTQNTGILTTVGCIQKSEEILLESFGNTGSGEWLNILFTVIMLIFAVYLVLRFRRKQHNVSY